MPIVYPYVVTMIAEKPGAESQMHTVKVEAYTIEDAFKQVLWELDAKFSLIELGFKLKIVSITPDSEKAESRVLGILSDLDLIRATPQGKKS